MKQFKTILAFELKYFFKNKVFVGVTLFLMVLIAGVMFFPRIREGFTQTTDHPGQYAEGGDSSEGGGVMYLLGGDEDALALLGEAFPGYRVLPAEDEEVVRAAVASGEAECAFRLDSPTEFTYLVDNLSMYDSNMEIAGMALTTLARVQTLTGQGLSPDQALDALSVEVTGQVEKLGVDQMQNFFYTYIMIFALYMVILLYGQMVATNVASEKSSRAMELLITSARPTSMMFGKVIASCLAGLIQLVCVFGTAFVCYNLNRAYWGENPIVSSIFGMPLSLLIYMLVFFVLGFFIYAFLYGAIGSTASKVEDINTSVMPLTMLFIIAFMVVIFSMTSGSVDNTAMTVCSFVPFTSPMAMFTRIAMSTVPFWQIALSIAILIASVIGVGVLSAKIYRVGVLMYGAAPKPAAILRAIRKA